MTMTIQRTVDPDGKLRIEVVSADLTPGDVATVTITTEPSTPSDTAKITDFAGILADQKRFANGEEVVQFIRDLRDNEWDR